MHCLRSEEARNEWKKWFNIVTRRKVRSRVFSKSTDGRGISSLPKRYNKNATLSTSNKAWSSDTLRRAVHFDTLKRSINDEDTEKQPVVFMNEGFKEKKDLNMECAQSESVTDNHTSTVISNFDFVTVTELEGENVGTNKSYNSNEGGTKPLTVREDARIDEEVSTFEILWVNEGTASALNEQTDRESCVISSGQIELSNLQEGPLQFVNPIATEKIDTHSEVEQLENNEQVEVVGFLENLSSAVSNLASYLQTKSVQFQ